MPLPAQGTHVVEFVRALALAWKNLAAYPPGHPALANSIEFVHRRLAELRGPGGEVIFGIANDGLIYGDEKVDSPHAQKFAQALYTRGVAMLRFETATEVRDIDTFLRVLGVGDVRGNAEPIWEALTAAGVVNILLQPVDYSAVQVTDRLDEQPEEKKPATLWDEILRALIAGHELSPSARELPKEVHSVNELTALILRYLEESKPTEFDPNATFGVRMMQRAGTDSPAAVARRVSEAIGLYLAGSTGLKKQLVVQQVLQLIRTLPEQIRAAVMRSVIRVLATEESSGSLLREFVANQPADQVLDALRALSGVKLSTHATLLLQSLAPIDKAEAVPEKPAPHIVSDLVKLFAEEDIDRFNPPDHKELLDFASIQIPLLPAKPEKRLNELGDRVESVTEEAVNDQVARTLLDLLARMDPKEPPEAALTRAEMVFRTYLAERRYRDAVAMLEELQQIALMTTSDSVRTGIHEWFERIVVGDTIQALIASLVEAKAAQTKEIHRLIEAMGSAATRNLLIALAEEENRSRRRRLFDLLVSLGSVIVPEVAQYLSDPRWFVVRNMIVLLRAVNDRSTLGEIRRLALHGDLRVRLEAIKTLLAFEQNVPQTLLENVINDRDPKLAETAITLVGNYGIKEAVGPLLQILQRYDILGVKRPIRLRAIKALGELAVPSALPALERFFKDPFLPWPVKDERRAAFESLSSYPHEVRAPFVEQGLLSRDPEIREICRKLSQ